MKRRAGFTMIELVVVVGIVGIMAVTAVPLYRTYQQRAYGSEASLMLKRILDAQVLYYLDNEKFFPEFGQPSIDIYHNSSPSSPAITATEEALNLTIPVRHFLDYSIVSISLDECQVIISSHGGFPLYKDGSTQIRGKLDRNGGISIF